MLYLAGAAALGALLVAGAVQVWRESGDKTAKLLFGYSVLYLFLLFALMLLDRSGAATGAAGA
jgi:protoheme IX farnesyltransferase